MGPFPSPRTADESLNFIQWMPDVTRGLDTYCGWPRGGGRTEDVPNADRLVSGPGCELVAQAVPHDRVNLPGGSRVMRETNKGYVISSEEAQEIVKDGENKESEFR